MPELNVDQTEIGLIIMGLNSIEEAQLTEDGKAARARLAYKLGGAYGEVMLAGAREHIAYMAGREQAGDGDA
jgi:hypothetical protein